MTSVSSDRALRQEPEAADVGSGSFTPGPWRSVKSGRTGRASAEFYIWHAVKGQGNSPAVAHIKHSTKQPTEANARLIAAAPDLLAQCKRALDAWTGDGPAIFLDDLRAVIAQATGSRS